VSNEDRKPTKSQLPHEVPAGQETAVPKGMIPAVGVIPHPDQDTYPGVLVMARNHDEVVSWHNKGCKRKRIKPDAVKFDRNGAPWCPVCYRENQHRDPDWNSEPTPAVNIPEPINSPKTEATAEHRADREERIEKIRAAREANQFKDPAVESIPIVGDDQTIAINPPEKFGD
jgi:hypothetical protein